MSSILLDYNEWNLPFTFSLNMQAADADSSTSNFPKANYLLSTQPSAVFSVVFVDTNIVNIPETERVKLDYSWYGN